MMRNLKNVTNSILFQVSWRRANETAFLTIGKITISSDKRYEVAHTGDSNDWNLMISNLSTQDTGAYECQISSVDKGLRKEVYLNVKGTAVFLKRV